jgi:hypothetical protein
MVFLHKEERKLKTFIQRQSYDHIASDNIGEPDAYDLKKTNNDHFTRRFSDMHTITSMFCSESLVIFYVNNDNDKRNSL